MQSIADKTFGSAEINHRSNSDDGNKIKSSHENGILNDKVSHWKWKTVFWKTKFMT